LALDYHLRQDGGFSPNREVFVELVPLIAVPESGVSDTMAAWMGMGIMLAIMLCSKLQIILMVLLGPIRDQIVPVFRYCCLLCISHFAGFSLCC
jgi:hypothetical protein